MIKPPGQSGGPLPAVLPSTPIQRIGNDAGRLLVAVQKAAVATPHFAVGETVTARLVEALPQRQWLAVVKETPFTLQWPGSGPESESTDVPAGKEQQAPASPPANLPARGDVLTLRVVSTTPRLTFVLAADLAHTASVGTVAVQLSDAARKLSELVRAGERGTFPRQAASIDTAALLLVNPGDSPSARAQAMAQSVRQSGLFYESHLKAWSEGRLSLAMLRNEPQARAGEALNGDSPVVRETATAELGQMLQRQLDALDGKPIAFSGQAWPGQRAEWQIQREPPQDHPPDSGNDDTQDERHEGQEPAPAWTTQIHLDSPNLGALGATLKVAGSKVSLVMTAGSSASAGLIDTYRDRLQEGMRRAGLSLSSLSIAQDTMAQGASGRDGGAG